MHLKPNITCRRPPNHPSGQISEALGGVVGSRPLVCGGRLYNGRTESSCFALVKGGTAWKATRGMTHKRRFASAVTFRDEGVYPKLSCSWTVKAPPESLTAARVVRSISIAGGTYSS